MKPKANSTARATRRPKRRSARKFVFPVVIERDEGGFFAVCPSLQGCYAEGDTLAEATQNIEEVVQLHVESRLEHGEEVPEYEIYRLTTVEVKA